MTDEAEITEHMRIYGDAAIRMFEEREVVGTWWGIEIWKVETPVPTSTILVARASDLGALQYAIKEWRRAHYKASPRAIAITPRFFEKLSDAAREAIDANPTMVGIAPIDIAKNDGQ